MAPAAKQGPRDRPLRSALRELGESLEGAVLKRRFVAEMP
jgi:hypothetical protein